MRQLLRDTPLAFAALAATLLLAPARAHCAAPTVDVVPSWSVHFDIYLFHVGGMPLGTAPLRWTGAPPPLGPDLLMTYGLTPYTAPHFGLSLDVPYVNLAVHGGYLYLSNAYGPAGATGTGSARLGFVQGTVAARAAVGVANFSLGPSLGLWWVGGRGWELPPLARLGADAEVRFRVATTPRGGGTANGSMDFFFRFTCVLTDGPAWMLSFGEGIGTRPGR